MYNYILTPSNNLYTFKTWYMQAQSKFFMWTLTIKTKQKRVVNIIKLFCKIHSNSKPNVPMSSSVLSVLFLWHPNFIGV